MKEKSDYLKKLIKVLIYPVIFSIVTLIVQYIFIAIYNSKLKMSSDKLIEYVKTTKYQTKLTNYINNNSLFIILIIAIIFIPIFLKIIKKYKTKNEYKLKDIIIPILLGISISLIYNITIFNLNNIVKFTDAYNLISTPIIIQILSTGIIGPILEELLFRGIVYNKLKEFNKPMRAIILASIIFAIMHSSIIDMVYAFGVSFMFIYLYEKYKTLKAPIIMHITLNTTIIVFLKVIVYNNVVINFGLLLVSIITLLVIRKKYIK